MATSKRCVWALGCLTLILVAGQAFGYNDQWINTGEGDWADGNNWLGVVPPVPPLYEDRASFWYGGTANIQSGVAAGSEWLQNQASTINILSGGSYRIRSTDWNNDLGTGWDAETMPETGITATINMYDGSSFEAGNMFDWSTPYAFNIGGMYYDSTAGGIGYFNQFGGTATFLRPTTQDASYHTGTGVNLGQSADGDFDGGQGFYTISGGSMSIQGSDFWIGCPGTPGSEAYGGSGTFKVVGTGPTAITVDGGAVHLGNGAKSRIVADISATGITPIVVANSPSIDFTAGSVLQVENIGAVDGTYTVMSWDPAVTTVNNAGLTLEAPSGWSMNVGASALTVTLLSALKGDLNWDGLVNNQDINPFVQALTNLPAWQAAYPGKDVIAVGDCSLDGIFNNQDINPFIVILTSGSAVPEPVTLAVLGLGGLALIRKRR